MWRVVFVPFHLRLIQNSQELERIAEELKMTDAQQRSFMLKSSMRRLADSTKLPPRESSNPVEAIVAERVFAGETGYLSNSKVTADNSITEIVAYHRDLIPGCEVDITKTTANFARRYTRSGALAGKNYCECLGLGDAILLVE